MRSPLPAVAACLLLAPAAGSLTMAAQRSAPPSAAGAPGASAPAKQPAPPATPPSIADNDAAARHAKRTACLKDARAKKLVGAQRTAYVKQCVGIP